MRFRTTYVLFALLAIMFGTLAIALYVGPEAEKSAWVFPNLHDPADEVKTSAVSRVVIERERPGKEKIELTRTADGWKVNQFRASRSAVEILVKDLFDLSKEKSDKPASLKDWGLEPPAAVITMYDGDKVLGKLNVGDATGGGGGAVVYVLNPDRPKEPMAVSKSAMDKALQDVNAFRDRVLLVGVANDIDAVRLSETGKAG